MCWFVALIESSFREGRPVGYRSSGLEEVSNTNMGFLRAWVLPELWLLEGIGLVLESPGHVVLMMLFQNTLFRSGALILGYCILHPQWLWGAREIEC